MKAYAILFVCFIHIHTYLLNHTILLLDVNPLAGIGKEKFNEGFKYIN